jgi:alpha-D-ribose 1-methylphosphonate 5-triphosphate synthase subunit PhnG
MIGRYRRTRILVLGKNGLASRLGSMIREKYPVREIEPANEGLVMIKMRETARNSLFYMGEVLVTEAKVRIGERVGIGIVRGHKPELAEDLAVIDAAWAVPLPECAGWESLLLEEEKQIEGNRARDEAGVLETRVSFETMDV